MSVRVGVIGCAAAIVAVCAVCAPASAQEGYPSLSWTGFTVGVHGLYLGSKVDFPGVPDYPAGPPRPSLNGAMVGGQIGYNMQMGGIVVGAVADLSLGNLTDTVRDGNYLTETAKIDRIGSLRAVLGLPMGPFLPYVTAGLGWMHANYGATCPDQAAVPFGMCSRAGPRSYNSSIDMTGLAIGGGLKYAITSHFQVGAEYLHFGMNAKDFTNGPIGPFPAVTNQVKVNSDMLKVSLDYKF